MGMAGPRRDVGCTAGPPPTVCKRPCRESRYNLATKRGACREGCSLAIGGRALRNRPARTASQRTCSCGPARRVDQRRDVELPPEGHPSSTRGEGWATALVILQADPHGRVGPNRQSRGAADAGCPSPSSRTAHHGSRRDHHGPVEVARASRLPRPPLGEEPVHPRPRCVEGILSPFTSRVGSCGTPPPPR